MAIEFVFNVIVARKSEIDANYPGGFVQFGVDWLVKPPERWCEDQHLIAFSSMGNYFQAVYSSLVACGVDVLTSNESKPPGEVVSRWNWLAVDTRECRRDLPDGSVIVFDIPRYWLKGEQPGETVNTFSRHPRRSTSAAAGTSGAD